MVGVLSNRSRFALLYKIVVVFETPQSALWPISNTTERFVDYSKRHRALWGVLF